MQSIDAQTFMATVARVGSGTTTPTNADTQLVTQVASTTTIARAFVGTTKDTTNGYGTHTNVYDFAAAGSAQTLNEVGISASSSGANLNTRALFPSTVNLNTGDILRLTYVITFSIPALITPITVSLAAVNGFNISGQMKVVGAFSVGTFQQSIFGQINAGGSYAGTDHLCRCAHTSITGNLFSAPTTFPTVDVNPSVTAIAGSQVSGTTAAYTTGSFTRTCPFVWSPSVPSTTVSNVNGIFMGSGTSFGLMLILTSAQTKANTNTLTVNTSGTIARA
jgi:hypothetical protein